LTYQHWAGVSPYTLPFGFAGTCVLDKQSLSTLLLQPRFSSGQGISHRLRPALLPSSLIIFLSIALVFSTNPPVSVCGTVKYAFSPIKSGPVRLFLEAENYQITPADVAETLHHSSINQTNGFSNSPYLAA
jgi:hypothetical protein